jgi:hypothetical protein
MTYIKLLAAAIAAAAASSLAHADVTIEQKTTFTLGSSIHMHGDLTNSITADKKREDSDTHCEGMMSVLCGNLQSGEIVRLDRDLTWRLQPKKKTYREEVFATPEQLALMRAKMQANLEKLRSCPASNPQPSADKSKCVMSPAKIDIHKTDDKMSIAGHDAQRTSATLTETCTDSDTGSACDTVVVLDVWLTQDKVQGAEERKAFALAYAKKIGLDDAQGTMRAEFARFLGPYQTQIKQITDKSSDLKGQPLRTSLRVVMGGAQCKTMPKEDGSGDSGTNPTAAIAQTGKAIGSLVGGMFGKKKTADSDAAASPAAPNPNDPYAQYTQLAAFNIETVSISEAAVPADRFEIPADWSKETPKPAKSGDDDVQCPKTGG